MSSKFFDFNLPDESELPVGLNTGREQYGDL